jgi:GntR family transcriptional regulator
MVPIYEQIVDQIKMLIRNGELKENDNLPSVRTLSKELKISALTVKKAYDNLESEGFTVTVHGKGTYVAATNTELLLEEQKKELEADLEQDNIGLISRKMDLVKEWMPDVSIQQLYEEVTRQTLLTSLKELFGAVCIVGTIFLLFLLSQKVWRKLLRYVRRNHPRYIQLLKRSQPAQ